MTARRLQTSWPWPAIVITGAFLAAGCDATPPHQSGAGPVAVSHAPPAVTPSTAGASILPADNESADDADNPIDHVIAISVDGLNPQAIRQLGESRAPAFHRLMREGAFTLNARTVREKTRTLPNHTTMLTGRRVDREHGGHGYSGNLYAGETVHRAAGHYIASVFDVVHDHGGSTALLASKTKFNLYERTWNTHGAPDRVGRSDGRAKIDRFTINHNDARLVAELTAELRRGPREFTFLHLSLPDRFGHAMGFMSEKYLAAVERTDRLLGRILDTVADRPALQHHTLIILTADHGGAGGRTHNQADKLQNFRIPFMVWGPGVAAGRSLYGLNPSLRNPGASRTSYHGRQPIRNGDLANLTTDVLDLPRIPDSEFDNLHTLDLFR